MKLCGKCGASHTDSDTFCMHCGHQLDEEHGPVKTRHCAHCNLRSAADDSFCIHCGRPLSEAPISRSIEGSRHSSHTQAPSTPLSEAPISRPVGEPLPVQPAQITNADTLLTKALVGHEKEVEQLQGKLKTAISRLERLETGEDALQKTLKTFSHHNEEELHDLRNQLAALKQDKGDKKSELEVSRLRQHMAKVESRIADVEQQKSSLDADEKRLQDTIAYAQELDKMMAAVALTTKTSIHQVEQRLDDKEKGDQSAAAKEHSAIVELKKRLATFEVFVSELEKHLTATDLRTRDSLHQLERRLDEQALTTQEKKDLAALKKTVVFVEQGSQELEKNLTAAVLQESEHIARMRTQLTALAAHVEKLETEKTALKRQHTILSNNVAEKQHAADDVEQRLDQLTSGLVTIQANAAVLDESVASKEREISALSERAEKALSDIAETATTLQSEQGVLAAHLQETDRAVSSFQQSLQKQLASLSTHFQQVSEQSAALEKNMAVLTKDKKDSFIEYRQHIEEQVAAIETNLATLIRDKNNFLELHRQVEEQRHQVDRLDDAVKAVCSDSDELRRVSGQVKELQAAVSADSLEKEMEIGSLRQSIDQQLLRLDAMENAARLPLPQSPVIDRQRYDTLDNTLAEQSAEMRRLADHVQQVSSELKGDVSDLRALMETDASRVLEKQVVENTRMLDRIQKGMGKIYAEVGSLVSEKGRWVAIIEKEIRERVASVLAEQKKEEVAVQGMINEIASEFSKINILLNHQDKRIDFFISKTEEELKEMRDRPESFASFSSAVIAELDEIKFRMQNMEHKGIHTDAEQIVDTITELEHKIDSLRALQPIIIE